MTNEFICTPIHALSGDLVGADLIYGAECGSQGEKRATRYGVESLSLAEKQSLLFNQLMLVEQYIDFFRDNHLVCSINIDFHLADVITRSTVIQQTLSHLPFIRLKLSENFPNLHDGLGNPLIRSLTEQQYRLWLDDLGAGFGNLHALQSHLFEAVKLDQRFYRKTVNKAFFSVLISKIRQYTDQIIIDGVQNESQFDTLRRCEIWGVQGYYMPSIPLTGLTRCQGGI